MKPEHHESPAGLLVIGYGNTLRSDDGVGPKVADAVAALALIGVRALACPLLTPELADPVSQARVAVFVDAAVDAPLEVQLLTRPVRRPCWLWPVTCLATPRKLGS